MSDKQDTELFIKRLRDISEQQDVPLPRLKGLLLAAADKIETQQRLMVNLEYQRDNAKTNQTVHRRERERVEASMQEMAEALDLATARTRENKQLMAVIEEIAGLTYTTKEPPLPIRMAMKAIETVNKKAGE